MGPTPWRLKRGRKSKKRQMWKGRDGRERNKRERRHKAISTFETAVTDIGSETREESGPGENREPRTPEPKKI